MPEDSASSSQRTAHDQEEDTMYSPRGWRDKEYRNYTNIRLNAAILVVIGGMTAMVSLLSIPGRSGILESVALVLVGSIGNLMAISGLTLWGLAKPYSRTRRLGK